MNLGLQRRDLILIILALILFTGLALIGQTKETIVSDSADPVDEALLRVPLPPTPDILREEVLVIDNSNFTSATTLHKRELLGMRPVEKAVSNPTESCFGDSKKRFRCYADFLSYTVDNEGIEEAFIKLKKMYNASDSYAISQCHQLSHVIGRAATIQFPTVAESYNYGDTFCWSGYYHGIMEAIISEIGLEEVPERLNDICSTLPGKENYSFNYFNCVHGLGHGVMYVEGHHLFNALSSCDNLDNSWERSSCYGGVFMENVIVNEIDHVSEYLKDDDLIYPCNAVEEKYKTQCYLMQTSHILSKVGYNFEKVFDLCSEADSNYIDICYQSLGRDASGNSTSDISRTRATCLLGPNENAQKNCVIGAVKDFVSYFHSDSEALSLCSSLPDNLKNACKNTVKSYYISFNN